MAKIADFQIDDLQDLLWRIQIRSEIISFNRKYEPKITVDHKYLENNELTSIEGNKAYQTLINTTQYQKSLEIFESLEFLQPSSKNEAFNFFLRGVFVFICRLVLLLDEKNKPEPLTKTEKSKALKSASDLLDLFKNNDLKVTPSVDQIYLESYLKKLCRQLINNDRDYTSKYAAEQDSITHLSDALSEINGIKFQQIINIALNMADFFEEKPSKKSIERWVTNALQNEMHPSILDGIPVATADKDDKTGEKLTLI